MHIREQPPRKALLLAAGRGERLRPITETTPKCLVPINGRPLLYYWIDHLCSSGADKIIINTHYLADQVKRACEELELKHRLTLCFEQQLLGTAGTLAAQRKELQSENFWFVHADNLSMFNTQAFIKSFVTRPRDCVGTMMSFHAEHPEQCGTILCDNNGVLKEYFEKLDNPKTNLANGAVFIFDSRIFDILESINNPFDFCRDVVPKLLGRMNTFMNDGYHRDIGTVESYLRAVEDFRCYDQEKSL